MLKALRLTFPSPLTVGDRSTIALTPPNNDALKLSSVLAVMNLVLYYVDLDFLSRFSISIYMASPLRTFFRNAATVPAT